eukprot:TRINITY_DN21174_c0_g1_i1.p1 TRINITY_DN21174_c0_g1~~TRINITY_DN21174_c0_g1_i1.p1  ORF type:complete len:204 (+),score=45.40 TRINITY_DN21174_c0_g1_i1:22-612(+)
MALWFEAPLAKLEGTVDALLSEKQCIAQVQPALTKLRTAQQDVQATTQKRIRALTREVENEEGNVPVCRSKEEYAQLLDDLGGQQHDTALALSKKEESVNSMRAEIAALKKEIEKLDSDQTQLDTELKALQSQRAKVLLYMNASNIKWDYTDDSVFKGFVVKENVRLRTIEMDPNKHSQYYIADKLWEHIAWSASQ